MPLIMINCPSTGQSVSTGMAADAVSWAKVMDAWVGTSFRCPACNKPHTWSKRDAHLGRPKGKLSAPEIAGNHLENPASGANPGTL
jgi:hypothetical protein